MQRCFIAETLRPTRVGWLWRGTVGQRKRGEAKVYAKIGGNYVICRDPRFSLRSRSFVNIVERVAEARGAVVGTCIILYLWSQTILGKLEGNLERLRSTHKELQTPILSPAE